MFEWLQDNERLMWTLTGVSIAMFIASLVLLPFIIIRMPADYFQKDKRPTHWWDDKPAWMRIAAKVGKNALGAVLVPAGIAMLLLPGQGVLSILVGLMLIDFPGKFRFERWLVCRRGVQKTLNWIRRKGGKPLLQT